MSEITIQSGHTNPFVDPMRLLLVDAARPHYGEQDPLVAARCPEVLQRALSLLWRFTSSEEFEESLGSLYTPEVIYETPEGHLGLVRVHASVIIEKIENGQPSFILEESYATLHGRTRRVPIALSEEADDESDGEYLEDEEEKRYIEEPLLNVEHDRIHRHTSLGDRAGNMADLNFFDGVVNRIREKAFPTTR